MRITLTGFADEIHPNFEKQLTVAAATGVKAIEIRGVNGRGIQTYAPKEAEGLQKLLAERGMHVSSVGSPIGKIGITDDFAPHFEAFKNVVALCKVFGTKNIRMFNFYVPEGQADAYADEVMRRLDRLAEYAAKQDVVLLHENEKAIYGDIATRCKAILERFYGPHFRAVFDFANFVQCGQDTLAAYALLKPYIAYIHIKDALFAGGRVTPAGWGQGNVKAILADLKASGYEGYLSLEPHLADFAGFGSLENGNAGDKWRIDGETAWRIALDALKAILWELDWQ
ncbi:MAG: sugar phosphate isomerase/epimerase [Clostridia bacterium]|nr:sugar phosphate isomerase/epimerase [Clostridia bacterium]